MKFIIWKFKKNQESDLIELKIKTFLFAKNWILATSIKDKMINFVFIIGGDGTFLNIFSNFINLKNVKFILIKNTSIGFFFEYNLKNLDQLLNQIINNNFKISKLPLIELKINDEFYYAINEFKIISYNKPFKLICKINSEFLQIFNGSGIVISTNKGSSGFNYSNGGSLIISNKNMLQLKGILQVNNIYNNSIKNSIVFDDAIKFNFKTINNFIDLYFIMDNRIIKVINNNIEFFVRNSKKTVSVIGNLTEFKFNLNKIKSILLKK